MKYFLLLAVFLIFSTLFQSEKAEAAARTKDSLAHCKKKCGGVDIPYPFGVKEGCYFDESFNMTCNGYVARIYDTEVDAISLANHTLRAKGFSVLSLPYNISEESGYVNNFTMDIDEHYSISRTRNTFIVIGCNFMAYILDPKTKDFVAGCTSLCNSTDVRSSPPSTCSGQKCCKMSLGKYLVLYELHIEPLHTTTKSWKCGFFTFLDNDFPVNKLKFSGCVEAYEFEVIVDWAVGNTSCKEVVGRGNYLCGSNTECFSKKIGFAGYRCKCLHGFTGNPYILEGCQQSRSYEL